MASIDIVLYTSKILKNGDHPIMLRIIKDRKPKYYSTGERCSKEHWDIAKNQPLKKHPYCKELTIKLEDAKTKAKKTLLGLEGEDKDFSIDEFSKKLNNRTKKTTVIGFIDTIIENLMKINKIGNANIYKNIKLIILKFTNNKDIMFSDIDVSFLIKLEQHFRERGITESSMSHYFRTIHSVYNKAVAENYAKKDSDPFLKIKPSKFNTKTKKRAISIESIKKIEALELKENSRSFLSQKAFIFSYYCMGLNINDLMKLKWENINEKNQLEYIRSKTKKRLILPLSENANQILKHFKENQIDDYIFPFLNEKRHITPQQISNRVKKITRQINEDLKVFAESLGLTTKLTSYVSRHSSASALNKSGVSGRQIKDLMGHQTENETMIYLADIDPEDLREIVNLL